MSRFLFASAAALALALATPDARANGRFPESNQIVFAASEPDLVLIRVTFGLLVSHDRGKTFDWVCETSIGYTGVEDPMYTVTPSGRYIGSTFQGLTLTSDKACNWGVVGTPQPYIDLAANPSDAKNVIALSTVYKGQDDAGNVRFASSVAETKDEGSTWKDIGPALDDTILGHTLDFTASDPNRLYVTAIRYEGSTPVGLLFTSTDRGQTWSEQVIALEGTERAVFIAGVDPNDADVVYLRTTNNPDKPGRLIVRSKDPAGDVDGGARGVFRTVFTGQAPLEGFALTPDGKKVFVGSPLDGVWSASTADLDFTKRSSVEVKCLALNGDELWACSNEKNGFIAGVSRDDGATFTPALNFCTIRGPLACPEGSTTQLHCPDLWAAQRDVLGCGGSVEDAGADGSFEPPVVVAPPESGKSCDCQAVIPPSDWSTAGGTIACAIGAAAAIARRSRRRR